jgi:prolipoprotein diacylglyceryltransferase
VNYFSLLIGVGAAIGLWRVYQTSPQDKRKLNIFYSLIVLLGALIGARISFILAHISYYQINIDESYQLWLGGLSGYGAFAGGIITCLVTAVIRKAKFRAELDQIAVMLLPIATAIWVGCTFAGVSYGAILQTGTWWGIRLMDESGVMALRVPVQPAGAISLIILLGFTEYFLKTPRQAGLKAGMIGMVFSIHTLLFSLMRVDPVLRLLGQRLDTWVSVLFLAGSLILVAVSLRKINLKRTAETAPSIEVIE